MSAGHVTALNWGGCPHSDHVEFVKSVLLFQWWVHDVMSPGRLTHIDESRNSQHSSVRRTKQRPGEKPASGLPVVGNLPAWSIQRTKSRFHVIFRKPLHVGTAIFTKPQTRDVKDADCSVGISLSSFSVNPNYRQTWSFTSELNTQKRYRKPLSHILMLHSIYLTVSKES